MARINLLPWREAYRQEKKKEFFGIIVIVGIVCAVAAYLWVSSVQTAIADQTARNRLLTAEIAELDKKVDQIKVLRERREQLLARMRVIQDLEGTRPVIVRYFDDMVRAIPDGVFLNRMTREGRVIRLEGIAESNNRVSNFMRNLDQSDWFTSPNLSSVTSAPAYGEQANSFIMSVRTSAPADQDSEEGN
ncbi:PilN domain-containing protein [Marinimicrobium sp. ABcell2]|uniref:PilN domain-containing protein n=1 Tax=Marinimicrobium sp. ABcell2 TaxID=3069751 RepID=UPI0027AE2462|nr:PilN domain-containing protein [Marinimicrobium sp. ABcell2]MDQ2076515.1 PilN domain-containing protein [Marinimicrobium sp. ABcell2]